MAVAPGTRIGPYEILTLLGRGGMGEVYRARDTKLDREVAIKILPELFVSDPERIARFQREAKTLAALNHPHIGSIYGLEDARGVRALVQLLPGGSMLFTLRAGAPIGFSGEDTGRIVVQIPGGDTKTILTGGADARYLSTCHIVYANEGVLYAVSFDARQLKVTGTPVPVVQGVVRTRATGVARVAISRTGSMVYSASGSAETSALDVGLLDLNSTVQRLKLPSRAYYAPRVSPDGRQLAVSADDGKEADIWIYELSGGSSLRQLTFRGRTGSPRSASVRRLRFRLRTRRKSRGLPARS